MLESPCDEHQVFQSFQQRVAYALGWETGSMPAFSRFRQLFPSINHVHLMPTSGLVVQLIFFCFFALVIIVVKFEGKQNHPAPYTFTSSLALWNVKSLFPNTLMLLGSRHQEYEYIYYIYMNIYIQNIYIIYIFGRQNQLLFCCCDEISQQRHFI